MEGARVEEALEDGRVDALNRLLGGEGDAKRIVQPDEAGVDVVAAGHHGRHVEHVLDVLDREFLAAVVDEALVDEHLEQRVRLLRAVSVDLGHVEVVDEDDELLACGRAEGVLGALLDRRLDGRLHVQRGGTRREVDAERRELVRVAAAEILGDHGRLGGAALAHKEARAAHRDDRVEQPRRAHRVEGGHHD